MGADTAYADTATKKRLREAMRSLQADPEPAAVATVTAVEGSAYRRPGAKMLIPTSGENLGAVTAGCIEGPVADIGTEVADTGTPQTARFDLTDDEGWGLGLGCNGVIDLLIEPLDSSWNEPLAALADGDRVAVVTVIESAGEPPVGSRAVLDKDGIHDVEERTPIPDQLLEAAAETTETTRESGSTQTLQIDETTLLIEGLEPVPELRVFGSQNDITPVVDIATRVGFEVTVHAPRGGIDETTFPRADTVRTGHPTSIADDTDGEHTYAIVMSHNLVDDSLAVATILKETDIPYVGLMGPRERFDQLRETLETDGVELTDSELTRVSTPVGLDLGGGEPVEIALSVVSEVLAVSNGCDGGRLKDRAGRIHPRDGEQ